VQEVTHGVVTKRGGGEDCGRQTASDAKVAEQQHKTRTAPGLPSPAASHLHSNNLYLSPMNHPANATGMLHTASASAIGLNHLSNYIRDVQHRKCF
jgi:hypothetical protein